MPGSNALLKARRRAMRTLDENGRWVAPATKDDGTPIPHGLRSTYQTWVCRCGPCSAAASEYEIAYRTGLPTKTLGVQAREIRRIPTLTDRSWVLNGKCREMDPELFDLAHKPAKYTDDHWAAMLCRGCPVIAQCRTDAEMCRPYDMVQGGRTWRGWRRATA